MQRVAPLLPFARAPDVQDLLELLESNWYGTGASTPDVGTSSVSHRLPRPLERESPGRGAQPRAQHSSRAEQNTTPRLYSSQQRIAESPEGLEDGLGTWAERQQVFSRIADANDDNPLEKTSAFQQMQYQQEQELEQEAGVQQGGRAAGLLQDSPEVQTADIAPTLDYLQESSEDADMNAAWRWRFTRKWQQEQMRQLDGATSAGAEEDDWATALDYMATAAGGMNLQFGRTTSLEHPGSLEPSLSQCMSLLLDASMSRDSFTMSYQGTPGRLETPMATRRIAQATKKAEELMAHQAEIEKQVAERWEHAEAPWAAQAIPAVNMDSWGKFTFILARAMDLATGRQKLLIRGRNILSLKQVADALEQEVTAEALSKRLSVPKVEVLGSGKMEWSRERDRCLIITGCTVHSSLDTRLKRKEDVARVAGALARTSLSALHSVIVDDGRQQPTNKGNRTSNS